MIKALNVIIACEFSGVVRESFAKRGHNAWSVDLLPTEIPGQHFKGDVFSFLRLTQEWDWDLIIAHPPCTNLSVSGARWFKNKKKEQEESIAFFMEFTKLDIPRICIENPICIMSRIYRKPDQIIQPWQFGHGETKATCLWLKNLPLLKPTNIVSGRENKVHRCPPGPERWKIRSRTYQGIADAMAEQWGRINV